VLAPASLRDRVAAELRSALQVYAATPPAPAP